jgi:pimeloyl-ACP methyl ester carboxylesterase
LKVAPADAQDIADAIRYVDGERAPEVGVVAFSYALGPAVLASLEPDIGRHVDFIVAIGGYYDIEAVVTFFTTGFYRPDVGGAWQYRVPNEYGKWVFARSNADRLASATDREALMEIARLKMTDPKADVAALAAGLGSEGRAVYALLTNQLPENVPRLIADLPDSIRSDLHALDLKQRDLSPLAGRLILVHGRDDPIIPFSESRKLARATPNSDLYVVDTLAHVDLGPSGVVDALKLLYVIYNLLERRDALAATVH